MIHVFIINPDYNDRDFATKLRERLSRIPDLTYYVFTTGAAGDETELAGTIEDIFEGEQLRIYSCGGMLSVAKIIDGIDDLNNIEIAIVPTRHVQYLEAFDSQEPFRDIEELIAGGVMRTDYIRTNHGCALNSISFGMDAYSYRSHDSIAGLRIFGKMLPWLISNTYAAFVTPNYVYNIEINGENMSRRAMQIMLSNVPVTAKSLVYSDNWDITDGAASFVAACRHGVISRFVYTFKLYRRSLKLSADDPRNTLRQVSRVRVRHSSGIPIWGCMDGRLVLATDWSMEVVKQGLKLVVPGGVSYERA